MWSLRVWGLEFRPMVWAMLRSFGPGLKGCEVMLSFLGEACKA